MEETDISERLEAIAARFFVPRARSAVESGQPPFDIGKPNLHDSKADFLAEKRAVETALTQANDVHRFLLAHYRKEDEGHEVARRVLDFVDLSARARAHRQPIDSPADMVRKNASDIGVSYALIFLMFDLIESLGKRNQELASQEAVFWTVSGRPPNHYARTIALRFAKLIARETGKRPTFGTSSDGAHPSTEFGRALQEVFEILKIEASVNHPAKWAIAQLTDDDLTTPLRNALSGFGFAPFTDGSSSGNALAAITAALKGKN